jgi:hypothetical protein
MKYDTPPTTREHTMAIYLLNTSAGPVDLTTLPLPTAPAPAAPTAGPLGDCGECGTELVALTGDNGEIRTTFCEYCD